MSESDPKTSSPQEPPHPADSNAPIPVAPPESASDSPNEVDASMGAAAEPARIDPTSEDLEDSELDDTEDRDYVVNS